MKKCSVCNSELPDTYVACPNCGSNQLISDQVYNGYIPQPVQQSFMQNMQQNGTYNTPYINQQQSIKNNFNAITGFICALIGFFFFSLVLSMVGLFCGIAALAQINKTNEKGKGFAITAIIIGCLELLLHIYILF